MLNSSSVFIATVKTIASLQSLHSCQVVNIGAKCIEPVESESIEGILRS